MHEIRLAINVLRVVALVFALYWTVKTIISSIMLRKSIKEIREIEREINKMKR